MPNPCLYILFNKQSFSLHILHLLFSSMETSNLFIVSLISFCLLFTSGYASLHHHHHHHHHHRRHEKHEVADKGFGATKMFVFGDSYADTGNVRKSLGNSWKEPYGITFPGKPAGRFSDGRVFTDYLASFLGLRSPFPYQWMKLGGKRLRKGMNFAYGGSGVFNTVGDVLPNMSTQIGFFEKLVDESFYTKTDIPSSVFLVCLSGNDYGAYISNGGTVQGLQKFISGVITQMGSNLKHLQEMGATKVVVTSLQPLGCLPRVTQFSSYQQCNSTFNLAVNYHNILLQQTLQKLNNNSTSPTFFLVDLYTAFTTVLDQKGSSQGVSTFKTPLKPCCMGVSSDYFCGSVNDKGEKMYTVCSDPKSMFFWDTSHPTDAGWRAIFSNLKSGLLQFFQS